VTGNTARQFVRSLYSGFLFARAALVYWLQVFPGVEREVRAWRRRARTIPDADLRDVALKVLRTKHGNLEGAAAFAAFAPRRHRAAVIRAQVALQAIYDYVDTLSEEPNPDPVGNSRQLHQAVRCALEPAAAHLDYHARHSSHQDSGYVVALVEACRAALITLPSRLLIAAATRRFARRIIHYQSFNVPMARGDHDPLKAWAAHVTPVCFDLRWWETAASMGSSLGIFVLLALAADPDITPLEIRGIEEAYFPWIGALHSLLDHLIDIEEDASEGQRNFMAQYTSPHEAAIRLRMLTRESIRHVGLLPNATPHKLVMSGMVSFYLSAREARLPGVRLVTEYVLSASGASSGVALLMLRARRALDRLALPSRHPSTP
jgi:tetraprenyl-beta-curcumene synthase